MIVISHTLGNNSVRIEYRFKRDVHTKTDRAISAESVMNLIIYEHMKHGSL